MLNAKTHLVGFFPRDVRKESRQVLMGMLGLDWAS